MSFYFYTNWTERPTGYLVHWPYHWSTRNQLWECWSRESNEQRIWIWILLWQTMCVILFVDATWSYSLDRDICDKICSINFRKAPGSYICCYSFYIVPLCPSISIQTGLNDQQDISFTGPTTGQHGTNYGNVGLGSQTNGRRGAFYFW